MLTTFHKVLLGLILIVIVAYFLQSRANTPQACANIEGLWDASEQVCKTPTEKVIFQSLSKPHPVSILSPEDQSLIVLDKVELVDKTIYFRGQNTKLLKAGNLSTVNNEGNKREIVYMNMSHFQLLTTNTKQLTYFAVPFIVNNEKNDAYSYAGLFSYDFNSHQAKHLDSLLLGEHIRETEISPVKEDQLTFTFKSYGSEQVLTDYPNKSNTLVVKLIGLDSNSDEKAMFSKL